MAQRGARRPKLTPSGGDAPVAPRWLSGRALEIWDWMLPQLPWLTAPDVFAFSDWCASEAERESGGRSEWPSTRRVEHRRAGLELGIGGPFARAKLDGAAIIHRPAARARTAVEIQDAAAEAWWDGPPTAPVTYAPCPTMDEINTRRRRAGRGPYVPVDPNA
jgi:hypothetical protein